MAAMSSRNGAPSCFMNDAEPKFLNVTQTARRLGISRRTVQRNAPQGSWLRNKYNLVDADELRRILLIGAPFDTLKNLKKSGYPAGVPRKESGLKGRRAWAARRKKQNYEKEKSKRKALLAINRRSREYPNDVGIRFSIEAVLLRFMGWKKFTNSGDPILGWETDRLRYLQKTLMPIIEFFSEIETVIVAREGPFTTQGEGKKILNLIPKRGKET